MIREILKLGDPALYRKREELTRAGGGKAASIVADLRDTLAEFRRVHGFGRAIAAPQIGEFSRVIYMDAGSPVAMINPRLSFPDGETMEVMDDCMCFPGLYVRVIRRLRCRVDYKDLLFEDACMHLEGGLSELVQHEYDHLDGILATMRAVDARSFSFYKVPPGEQEA